jgi:hypothetical protein
MADPQDCRNNANRCVLMASQAADEHLRSILLRLAKAWLKLAEQLEHQDTWRDARSDSDLIERNR